MRKAIVFILLFWIVCAYSQPSNVSISLNNSGFNNAVSITNAGDGTDRLFVTQQSGEIKIVEYNTHLETPFLDISTLVNFGAEAGLLGLAFHPNYVSNGYFYIFYSKSGGINNIVRYSVSSKDANIADPMSAKLVLQITDVGNRHLAGDLHFGPDGYLYVSTGDGSRNIYLPQDNHSLNGKILRIDIDSDDFPQDPEKNYAIPADNPHGTEMWLKGFRNPWRFSFDRLNGDMFIGDVGELTWEEFNFHPSTSPGGTNFGWPCYEGDDTYANNQTICTEDFTYEPAFALFSHNDPNATYCSAISGYRYRGPAEPNLYGWYFFSDWCDGTLWASKQNGQGNWDSYELKVSVDSFKLTAMGENEQGELFIVAGENIYRLTGEPINYLIFKNDFESN